MLEQPQKQLSVSDLSVYRLLPVLMELAHGEPQCVVDCCCIPNKTELNTESMPIEYEYIRLLAVNAYVSSWAGNAYVGNEGWKCICE